jgi:hypothetical protein
MPARVESGSSGVDNADGPAPENRNEHEEGYLLVFAMSCRLGLASNGSRQTERLELEDLIRKETAPRTGTTAGPNGRCPSPR